MNAHETHHYLLGLSITAAIARADAHIAGQPVEQVRAEKTLEAIRRALETRADADVAAATELVQQLRPRSLD